MAVFALRFDFRNPAFAGTTMGERYAAALDMVSWAEERGFMMVTLSEHHGSADGYLPRPLPMAAAIASRTKNMLVTIAAIPAPLHDPLHMAEELAVVDLISQGRVSVVLANGYYGPEFAMFDRSLKDRAKLTTEMVHTLRAAWTGEPFEFRGRTVQVTPTPFQAGGPAIILGGSVEAAARRAARIADGFMPSNPDLWEFYRDEKLKLGQEDPGPYFGGDTGFLHLSKDPEADWERIAPYAMHEVNAYGEMMAAAGTEGAGGYARVDSVEALKATGQYRVITPEQYVDELKAAGDVAFGLFHPMMGGIPPELGWESLRLLETEVIPNL
ncbi:LLM class flavin-dependent oxidoreductase [Yinghuangia seranimata]|uniref:LLM class flavin-dependent oxidoreductase n=1 Tax=Yinghuangia seranimata TaxID=408067 RepID=UPI00248C2BC7|nr:LLM class flavin-dependent oxidoreductase [Yinghuangia seranimata]MDI2127976.1 LLM class flavin-dependent oxidoreductase [Yinghuangia seranimata]